MTSALLHPFSKPSSDNFRTLVRSEGVRVWDDEGNEYMDGSLVDDLGNLVNRFNSFVSG